MFAFIVAALCLAGLESAIAWNYRLNGADWSGQGMCGKGGAQSPVNLPANVLGTDDVAMFLKYPKLESALTVYNNGRSIAFSLPENFRAGFGIGAAKDGPEVFQTTQGEAYRLWQVNFHSPSEHTIDGRRLPLEMQMMHKQVTGGGESLAVVVVLFDAAPNAYGEFLDAIIGKRLPGKPWQQAIRQPPLNFAGVIGGSPYYSYEGSLTTPPCEQQVKYFVRKETVPAAHAQLREFSKVLQQTCEPKGNFRLAKPLAGPVALVGSIDLIDDPGKLVKPVSSFQGGGASAASQRGDAGSAESQQEGSVVAAECGVEFLDNAESNIDRVQSGDPDYLIHAKTRFNSARRDYQSGQTQVGAAFRNRKMLQRLYDNTPGPVEKIEVKWKLTNAETLEETVKMAVPQKHKAEKEAYAKVVAAIERQCAEMQLAKKAAAEKANANAPKSKKAAPKKAMVVKRLAYPEPHVKLPTGLGGSPFTDTEPDGAQIVSDKIAVNLEQAEMPPSATVDPAKGLDASPAKAKGTPNKIMAIRLPLTLEAVGDVAVFSDSLTKTLAEIAHVSKDRLEVKEIHKAAVNHVHKVTGPPTLMQASSQEHLRKSLRRPSTSVIAA